MVLLWCCCASRACACVNADGGPIHVVAAGGIFDGRGLAMALALGASAVWVGTRFICAKEAGAPPRHQKAVIEAGYSDTIRTEIFTGRPLRIKKNPFVMEWDAKPQEMKKLLAQGIIPAVHEQTENKKKGIELGFKETMDRIPLLMGQDAAAITEILPAADIMEEMVGTCISIMHQNAGKVVAVGSVVNATASL